MLASPGLPRRRAGPVGGHEVREPLLPRVARQVRVVERRLAERLRRQLQRQLQKSPASLLVADLGPIAGEVVVDAVVVGGIFQAAAEGLLSLLAPAEAMEDQAEGGVSQSGFGRELDGFFGVVQRLAGPAQLREAERFAPYRADAAALDPRAASRRRRPPRLHILSPFDNAVVQRDRVKRLFDVDYALECYLPAAKRRFGYFALPVLWGDEFAARLDAKAERKGRRLVVKNFALEEGFEPSAEFRDALGPARRYPPPGPTGCRRADDADEFS